MIYDIREDDNKPSINSLIYWVFKNKDYYVICKTLLLNYLKFRN